MFRRKCFQKQTYLTQDDEYQAKDINELVTCEYDTKWRFVRLCDSELQVTFLHPFGPSKRFVHLSLPNKVRVPA
jgi:hypothetical protein